MPYVDSSAKLRLNAGFPSANVGELTYRLQQELRGYLLSRDSKSYATLAECLGALEGAKADFVERVLIPYELGKRYDNGDVWYLDGAGI